MAPLDTLLAHPHEARVHGQVEARRAGAEHHHAAALHDEAGDREGLLAGMLEHEVDVVALAGVLPDRPAELAALLHVFGVTRLVVDVGELAPAVEIVAVDDAARAQRHHEVLLRRIGDHADGVGAGRGDELDRHRAEAARGTPHQHVVAGPQDVRAMAEQHAIGRGEGERVGGALLPAEMLRALHELARLHLAELRERAVRRLVAPDALAGGEHRIAAVALLVVAIVLVTVDDDLVTDLPALHLGADRPDDARGIGARDVERLLVDVERRDRQAETGPDAVVVHARRHHENEHLVLADRVRGHHFELHGLLGRTVAVAPDDPGVHVLRHMPERRNLTDLVEILLRLVGRGMGASRESDDGHGKSSCVAAKLLLRTRECNAQNTIRNDWHGGKTTKLPTPCGNRALPRRKSRGRVAG